jgi:hypothetical protein
MSAGFLDALTTRRIGAFPGRQKTTGFLENRRQMAYTEVRRCHLVAVVIDPPGSRGDGQSTMLQVVRIAEKRQGPRDARSAALFFVRYPIH